MMKLFVVLALSISSGQVLAGSKIKEMSGTCMNAGLSVTVGDQQLEVGRTDFKLVDNFVLNVENGVFHFTPKDFDSRNFVIGQLDGRIYVGTAEFYIQGGNYGGFERTTTVLRRPGYVIVQSLSGWGYGGENLFDFPEYGDPIPGRIWGDMWLALTHNNKSLNCHIELKKAKP